ncbi:hypothetical protein A1Q1_02062 [Trichosporon asahii var. asahii CBS 2479]|uniref:DNA polymerase kappa n=1 Tax=Trichosporon asahii var. asahii (strain ATCC 90039 / CBS 2479 / JCM 2466 / KCTC 7840 / NBRC 103889/ NCYC 2677 / UAMH 7654) TaxID=1186058 RepID=J6FC98_TRIAS|nr:hypothetical protein A1Q1_02062 [Trichosporon asahii var. asahii CBS 2479]EJT52727.1 hypothetical protein A1Q1_02062 [Trichosporon asahii var. asahii CBS 2479]
MTDLRELGVADTEDLGDHGGVGVTETSSTAPVDLGLAASGPSPLSFSPPPLPLDEEDELPPGAPSSDPWTADDLAAIAAAEAAERQRLSFERSLAGPSVGKADGYADHVSCKLTLEINRIIAEASKGSKFYENQVRKDKELTEKIAWFCAKRDELLRETPREKILADADRILMEVEADRDLSQTIVHVDVDAFYAAVECKRDPSLKGKAFGVGQGVLTTASLTGSTPLHFDLYTEASRKIREVLLKVSYAILHRADIQYDANLMMAGLDEGITGYIQQHDVTALEAVEKLRAEVEAATGLTISAGIAPNRMLAKPNGVFELEFNRATIVKFMHDLPVRKIPGFGRVTERCLEGFGVELTGSKAHLGIADNSVQPYKREERKSVGVERTFRDKWEDEDILAELANIAEELEDDLKRLQYSGKTVTVKYKLHTYESKSRAQSVKKYINTKDDILPELPVRIRLLGIRLSNLKDLTVPETGIKEFFAKSASSSPKKTKPATKSPELDLSQIDEAVEASSSAPETSAPGVPGEALDTDPSPSNPGPLCPICQRALGPETTNAQLNEHIDLCLNRGVEGIETSPVKRKEPTSTQGTQGTQATQGRRKKKRKEGPTVLDWLKRG